MLNNKSIEEITNYFALGEMIGEPKILTGGDVNQNFKIATSTGEYVIKTIDIKLHTQDYQISKDILLLSLDFSESVAAHMQKNGIPTVVALNGKQQKTFIKNNFLFLIYPYFNGKSRAANAIKMSNLNKIATILAKIHSLNTQNFLHEKAMLKWNAMTETSLKILEQKPWNLIKQLELPLAIKTTTEHLEKFLEKILKTLPISLANTKHLLLTHNDLKTNNILWNNRDEPLIIDWEAAGYMPQDVDYLDTILAWCVKINSDDYVFDLDKLKNFIKEYKRFCSVPTISNQTIDIVVAKWIFWLAFCIKNILTRNAVAVYVDFTVEALKYLKFIKEHQELLKSLP